MNPSIFEGREPYRVLTYFEQLSAIPRGSGNEAGVADYLTAFAKARGLDYHRDEANNVLISAPATAGKEHLAPLLFQGHTDMVCEKNGDVVHDFEKDPIKLILQDDKLRADGTTLGADNGIAVAMMLALLDGAVAEHPAYECLFTTEEETGMGGAIAFDYSRLTSRHMINLDSESEHCVTVGCAGGIRTDFLLPVEREAMDAERTLCRVKLTGLCGGHSGEDINKGRANANLLLARLLCAIEDLRLVAINGGSKDNAIPRECEAIVALTSPAMASMKLLALGDEIAEELMEGDRNCHIACERLTEEEAVAYTSRIDAASTAKVLGLLTNLPNGVLAMSREISSLVEFSRNMGVIRTTDEGVTLTFTTRSSRESRLDASVAALDALAVMMGATATHHSRYPGWSYCETSAARDAYCATWEKLFGEKLHVIVIHAGLECGYIRKQVPDMDIISIGPDMMGIHSPDETLDLSSVARVFDAVCSLITDWKEERGH